EMKLRVAEIEADAELARAIEQPLRRRIGHLALEMRVQLFLSVVVPMRKERRQRAFGKHDEIAAMRRRPVEQHAHPGDGAGATFGARDRAELRGADGDDAAHWRPP